MLKINIIAVGGIKNKEIESLIEEYKTRSRVFCDVKIIEVKAEAFSENDKEKAKQKEWQKIKDIVEEIKADAVYLLAEDGREFDSIGFADKVLKDKSSLVFVIGGALGWPSEARLDRLYKPISLSQMTFPHELARLMLVEQIYRGLMIVNNRNYHY